MRINPPIFAYSFSAVPAYHLQYDTAFSQTEIPSVTLWHENYEIQGYGGTTNLLIDGTSSIAGGSTLRLDGTNRGDGPMPLINNGTMYVSGSTLFAGPLSGDGTIVASHGSVLDMQSAAAGETIQLMSSHLYIGGAQSIHPQPSPQLFGMSFLAPITNFGPGSSIVIDNTIASSEIFAKTSLTSGDLSLFSGTTEVANLRISGAANIYAQDVAGAVVLTATNPGAHLSTWTHF